MPTVRRVSAPRVPVKPPASGKSATKRLKEGAPKTQRQTRTSNAANQQRFHSSSTFCFARRHCAVYAHRPRASHRFQAKPRCCNGAGSSLLDPPLEPSVSTSGKSSVHLAPTPYLRLSISPRQSLPQDHPLDIATKARPSPFDTTVLVAMR